MAESNDKQPVLAVVGPTATGKTALGVELALRLGGEIISADSMQIYRGLDIGTAKVTPEETRGVPHHCVDILPPEAPFSVADFTALAGRLVEEIGARGRLPTIAPYPLGALGPGPPAVPPMASSRSSGRDASSIRQGASTSSRQPETSWANRRGVASWRWVRPMRIRSG